MTTLCDDELVLILSRIHDHDDGRSPSDIRITLSLVCKQWHRVEGMTRSSIRILEPDRLLQWLPRFPNLVSLESSVLLTDSHLQFIGKVCPKIELLKLKIPREISGWSDDDDELSGSDEFGDEGLCALASECPNLRKILLQNMMKIRDFGVVSLINHAALNLTSLDLSCCKLVTDRSLEAIGSAKSISSLKLQGCRLITDEGLASLSNGSASKTIRKLNFAECDRITDKGISLLQKLVQLENLNINKCGPEITDVGGVELAKITILMILNMEGLFNVKDQTLIKIAENCRELWYLDISGCRSITGSGIRAFIGHDCLEHLVMASCLDVYADDLVDTVFGCESLSYLVIDELLRMWVPLPAQLLIGSCCEPSWRSGPI